MAALFKAPKFPKPEPAPPVTPMPDPDDEALKARRERAAARGLSRTGRLSTMLSERESLG